VVESTALEMRHTGNRIGGSNPSLSAKPPFTIVHPVAFRLFMTPSGHWDAFTGLRISARFGLPSEREVGTDRAMEAWYHPSIA
jgi:hypothetical protein